jgi:beta-lactamase regulating signal transducer with metallopeptidase domain
MDGLAETLHQIVMGVWQATWRASLLIGIVLAIRALVGRRLTPRAFHVLWLVVVVRLLLPSGPASRWSLYNLLPQGMARSISISSGMRPVAPSDVHPQASVRSSSLADQPEVVAVEQPVQGVTDLRPARPWEDVASVLTWAWPPTSRPATIDYGGSSGTNGH